MIEWFSKSSKEMIATIHNTNITVNKPGVDVLSSAYAAMIGFDEEKKIVAIKPLSKDEYESGLYPKELLFPLTGSNSFTRVSSKDFIQHIKEATHDDFSSPKKYFCSYDQKEKLLSIDMNKEAK